jgi:hypothetical protein
VKKKAPGVPYTRASGALPICSRPEPAAIPWQASGHIHDREIKASGPVSRLDLDGLLEGRLRVGGPVQVGVGGANIICGFHEPGIGKLCKQRFPESEILA